MYSFLLSFSDYISISSLHCRCGSASCSTSWCCPLAVLTSAYRNLSAIILAKATNSEITSLCLNNLKYFHGWKDVSMMKIKCYHQQKYSVVGVKSQMVPWVNQSSNQSNITQRIGFNIVFIFYWPKSIGLQWYHQTTHSTVTFLDLSLTCISLYISHINYAKRHWSNY